MARLSVLADKAQEMRDLVRTRDDILAAAAVLAVVVISRSIAHHWAGYKLSIKPLPCHRSWGSLRPQWPHFAPVVCGAAMPGA
jgi:hypothetical protein